MRNSLAFVEQLSLRVASMLCTQFRSSNWSVGRLAITSFPHNVKSKRVTSPRDQISATVVCGSLVAISLGIRQ
jgi:hypothetical protein